MDYGLSRIKSLMILTKIFLPFYTLNKVTVSAKNLVDSFGLLFVLTHKLVTFVNVSRLWTSVSTVDMVHLESPLVGKTTHNAPISENGENIETVAFPNCLSTVETCPNACSVSNVFSDFRSIFSVIFAHVFVSVFHAKHYTIS